MDVLRTILKIQSLSAVRDFPTKKDKITFLSDAGLSPKEIAPIVGSSAAAVSQTIYDAKKKTAKEA
jgi:hypothetical protein